MREFLQNITVICLLILLSGPFTLPAPALAAEGAIVAHSASGQRLSWVDLADLALTSPTVLHARIDKIERLSGRNAQDVPPGEVRLLVEASLQASLKAPGLLPAKAEWLWQGPGSRNQWPFAEGEMVLLFARTAPGGAADVQMYQMVSPLGQLAWTPTADTALRDILSQALLPQNQQLMVTGVLDGFHSEGVIAGQSTSQFFLSTKGGKPLTLQVIRQPGALPQVTIATGDMIDRGQPVKPHTLAWRALTCGLPATLPTELSDMPGLSGDYELARTAIGPCDRRVKAAGQPASF